MIEFDVNQANQVVTTMVLEYGPKIVAAIIFLLVGLWVIGLLNRLVVRALDKRKFDATLKPFVLSLTDMVLKTALVISILSMLGLEMTSFIAVLGAAGLAIGLALSGTLQNFAGGIMLLLFKPFKVGDYISAQGHSGTVNQIQIFNTILKSPDNKTIIIPNGGLSTGSMINFSAEPRRRVDWTVGIAYGDDVAHAKAVLRRLCDEETRILKEPEVAIILSELGSSSVNITVRAWVEAGDYWGVFFKMNESIYNTFAQEGLNIPFPQMDVHLHKQPE